LALNKTKTFKFCVLTFKKNYVQAQCQNDAKCAAAKRVNYLKAKKLVVNFTPAVNSKINYSNSLRVAIKEKKNRRRNIATVAQSF
jgi:hypothetical protein